MKKICFVNVNTYSLFNPNSNAPIGGTEIQLFTLANYLKKYFDTSFIVGDWGQKKIEDYNGIKVYRSFSLEKTFINYIKAPFILWQKLKFVNADVYIASSAGAEIGIVALFCKLRKKKFIYRTANQTDCDGSFIKKNGLIGRVYQYGLKNADVIITQNKEQQKLLKNNYTISSSLLKNCYKIEGENIKFDNKKYILWVSRCIKIKRPELFLKLVKKFPQEKFVMISPMATHEKELFHTIKKQADKLPNLKFIESVPFKEIQKYFDKAKLFIGTSDFEGFPNTYLQACMGNTPVISLRVNPDRFITKNNLGYYANGDFSLMIKQIKNILNDISDWQEKSKNAYNYVKKNHDINIVGKQWRDTINNL